MNKPLSLYWDISPKNCALGWQTALCPYAVFVAPYNAWMFVSRVCDRETWDQYHMPSSKANLHPEMMYMQFWYEDAWYIYIWDIQIIVFFSIREL